MAKAENDITTAVQLALGDHTVVSLHFVNCPSTGFPLMRCTVSVTRAEDMFVIRRRYEHELGRRFCRTDSARSAHAAALQCVRVLPTWLRRNRPIANRIVFTFERKSLGGKFIADDYIAPVVEDEAVDV